MMTPEEFYNKHYQYPQSEVEQVTRESAIHFADAYRKHILASGGGSADVRCRFDSGDQVRVKFRKLDRYWKGMVHKDDGGKYVEVIKNGLHWEITKVERDRIKIAS